MNTTTRSFALKAGLPTEAANDERYKKNLADRERHLTKQLHAWWEKREDIGNGVSPIGRILQFRMKKRDSSPFAMLLGNNPLMTLTLIDNINDSTARIMKSLKTFMEEWKLTSAMAASYAAPVKSASKSIDLTNAFSVPVAVEQVEESLAKKIDKHVYDEKFAATSTAERIAKNEFVGPLRPEMQKLAAKFSNEVATKPVTKDEFVHQATKTLLQYKDIIFSAEQSDRFALSQSKFEKLYTEFSAAKPQEKAQKAPQTTKPENNEKTATVLVFKSAALHDNPRHDHAVPPFQTPVAKPVPKVVTPAPSLSIAS